MKFERVAVDKSQGAIIADAARLPEVTLKKGQVLEARATASPPAAGVAEITAARVHALHLRRCKARRHAFEILARVAIRGEYVRVELHRGYRVR